MKKYAKLIIIAILLCSALTVIQLECLALSENVKYYSTDFKKSSSHANTLASVAKAQVGKLTDDLGYQTAHTWNSYFIGDCARLAGIPNEIIPNNESSPAEMYRTLTKELGAKQIDSGSAEPGDLVFYLYSNDGGYDHCGIYVGDGKIIEGWVWNNGKVGVWSRENTNTYPNTCYIRPDYKSLSKNYRISFDEESSGLKLDKLTKKFGQSVSIPADIPTKDGKYFSGWSTKPNGKVEYIPKAEYKNNESVTLYAVFEDTEPVKYTSPLGGGNTYFGIDEMMYPGDHGTQFQNAIAKPGIWSPASGQYETFFGINMEESAYGNIKCVKVSLLDGYKTGYFDFNYYQHNCGYFMPSLDASQYKYLKIIYAYNNAASNVNYMKFWASKDVNAGEPLMSAYKTFKISNGYGQWQSQVVKLDSMTFQDGTKWADNTVRQFRIQMFEGNTNPDAAFYVAGFAFFKTEEEANAWDLSNKTVGANYKEYTDYKLGYNQHSAPLTGGIRLFGVDEMMYEGDKDTQFHNAFAKSDIINPINGRYENYFGTKMEKATHLGRKSVKVSLINSRTDGYLDFNYYQWDSKYYEPSLDGSKYKYLVINYVYPKEDYVPEKLKIWASKDVVPLGTNILKTGSFEKEISIESGKWQKTVIDLSALEFSDGTKWDESTVRQWRLHFFEGNTDINANVYISSIGFFETEEEALEWNGDTDVK
ncbi:MAG: InlB B-repeat-containing protein [Clostridia bacterium]|nr:InlB B-repeat-containing protein [Clostridia bacterium]